MSRFASAFQPTAAELARSAEIDRLVAGYPAPPALVAHPTYSARDYAYFAAKGYSDEDIVRIWSRDLNRSFPCAWRGGAEPKLLAVLRSAEPGASYELCRAAAAIDAQPFAPQEV